MTYLEFAGCTMTAYGPIIALFLITIMKDPVKVIILVASAFFWLLSLLLSSIVWFIIRSQFNLLFGVIIAVLFQEGFRYILYLTLQKSRGGLQYVSERNTMDNTYAMAYVSGLGFGMISGAFSLLNLLGEVSGPGTMSLTKENSQSFGLMTSIVTLCFSLLHIFWSVLFFKGVENKNKFLVSSVIICHLLLSSFTCIKQLDSYSVLLIIIITIVTSLITYRSIGGSNKICGRENLIAEVN